MVGIIPDITKFDRIDAVANVTTLLSKWYPADVDRARHDAAAIVDEDIIERHVVDVVLMCCCCFGDDTSSLPSTIRSFHVDVVFRIEGNLSKLLLLVE